MNWEKLETQHYFENPVEHVYTSNIFDLKEYHILYENQNNLNHQVWQQFDEKYKTGFEFKNDLTEIDFNKEVIALWFFKERSDRNSQPFIDLAGKLIPYYPNAFLLTTCKKIKIKEAKKTYIRRPVVQLDLSSKKYYEIIERFK